MKVTAIIPAAGSGARMLFKTSKPFIKILGKEIICFTLTAMEKSPDISEVVVALESANIPRLNAIIRREGFKKIKKIVTGGKWRCESVLACLEVSDKSSDFILIHDSARPLIQKDIIRDTIRSAMKYDCAIAGVQVKPTIKQASASGFVGKTLKRDTLWEAQTPQVFKAGILRNAYRKAGKSIKKFTDDSSLVESAGNRVRLVKSSYSNIKITTREDLAFAEALMKNRIKLPLALTRGLSARSLEADAER